MRPKKVQAELEKMKEIPLLYQIADDIQRGLNIESSEIYEIITTLLEKAEAGEFK